MSKTKVTRSQLAKAKRLRNYTNRIAGQNVKIIADVFIDFSNNISKDNGYRFADGENIKIIYSKFQDAMKKALKQIFDRNVNRSSEFVKDLFGWELKDSAIKAVQNKVIKEWSEKNAVRMAKRITESTKSKIAGIISKGQSEGLNQRDIVKKIFENVKDMSKARARTIARTETSKAVNITESETANSAGMRFKKWIYTHISKEPRKEHVALNGVRIKLNEYFNVNGFKGLHPHDPNLPAGEIINCECIVIYE